MPYKDPEKKLEYQRKYREKDRERKRKYDRKYYYKDVKKTKVAAAKHRARYKGLPFDLTPDMIEIPEVCPVLGISLEFGSVSSRDCSPSLDRIVPELGYVEGNIRVISGRANRIKSDASIEELEAILKYMKEQEDG